MPYYIYPNTNPMKHVYGYYSKEEAHKIAEELNEVYAIEYRVVGRPTSDVDKAYQEIKQLKEWEIL